MAVRKAIKTDTKKCTGKCQRELSIKTNFYNTNSPLSKDGKLDICKKCLQDMIDINSMSTVYKVLQLMDIPFYYDYWQKAKINKPDNPWGAYIRMANSGLNEFKNANYNNSIFEGKEKVVEEVNESKKEVSNKNKIDQDELDRLSNIWGYGYKIEELLAFERKYNFLKNNYPEKTNMHIEALQNYVRYQVKAEFAVAEGDVSGAKAWGDLANKQATNAKINPSQLSKADLSGGLSGFGELVRAVEQAVDIIPVLPRFKEKPQDKVDFTLWCYINYIRRLKGMPDAEYKEIYHFYEERKEEYKQKESNREFEFEDEGE